MRRAWSWLSTLGSSFLLAAGAVTAQPPAPVVPGGPAISTPAAGPGGLGASGPQLGHDAAEREVPRLMEKLSELGELVSKNIHSPDVWRHQQGQAEVMLQLAARSKAKERDDWLRMAVDSQYGAAVGSPENDPTARQALAQLAGQIGRAFPSSPVYSYAALQEVQADYMRALASAGDNPEKAQVHLRDRLLRFAQDHPRVPEAAKAILEAGQICEQIDKIDDARRCYRHLADHYSTHALARKAAGSLWRLAPAGEPVRLELPLLFPESDRAVQSFNLDEMSGKVVVVYFWSRAGASVEADFQALKQLTDRYQYRGLGVVYVNLDNDPSLAKTFLSGRLTSGVHVHQRGGLDSPVAERHGLQALPQALLVGPGGKLIKHSLRASQVEAEVQSRLKSGR